MFHNRINEAKAWASGATTAHPTPLPMFKGNWIRRRRKPPSHYSSGFRDISVNLHRSGPYFVIEWTILFVVPSPMLDFYDRRWARKLSLLSLNNFISDSELCSQNTHTHILVFQWIPHWVCKFRPKFVSFSMTNSSRHTHCPWRRWHHYWLVGG